MPSLRPFPPRRGQRLSLQGQPVHLHRVGRGVPVLVLHGNGSLEEEPLRALPVVQGVEWIAPDRPGYGLTPAKDSADPQALADWCAALLDRLGGGPSVVPAHSIA